MRTMSLAVAWACLLLLAEPARAEDAPAAPAAGAPLARIAFGSCLREQQPAPLLKQVLAADPQMFIWLGDNIYADTQDMGAMQAKYDKLGGHEDFKALCAKATTLATWDDHDYGENDAGAAYPKKAEAREVFLNFWKVPADSPRRRHEGVYDAAVFGPEGKRVQVILLDTRFFRGPLKTKEGRLRPWEGKYLATDDHAVPMLGEAQWTWLAEQLKQPAELRLLCSSIQVIPEEHGWEKWGNLPHERARLFKLLAESKAAGVVLLSGDRHFAELSRLPEKESGLAYPLYEVTSSSLNNKLNMPEAGRNKWRGGKPYLDVNFGLLRIDWDAGQVEVEVRGADGKAVIEHRLKLKALRP